MLSFAWFIIGFGCGACTVVGVSLYLRKREIAKRQRRAKSWQKHKKELDVSLRDDIGI